RRWCVLGWRRLWRRRGAVSGGQLLGQVHLPQALSSSGTLVARPFLLRQTPRGAPISAVFGPEARTGVVSSDRNCCMPPASFFPISELAAETSAGFPLLIDFML